MSNLVLTTEVVVDEVALEGLDGLTIESLWVRMSERMKWPMPLSNKIKEPLWSFVVRQEHFRFFRLAASRPIIRTYTRGDRDSMEDMLECPYTVYQRNDIELENGQLRGSCQDFATRELVNPENLTPMTLQEVMQEYGDTLVIVGSQTIREAAIIPKTGHIQFLLTLQQYCIIERIGRARWNGETTIGKYNIEEGNFFHVRKHLIDCKMLCKQTYIERAADSSNTGLLLHLPRFYQVYKPLPIIMVEHIAETIKHQPNCIMEYTSVAALFDESAFPVLRKIYKLPLFVQFFETDIRVPYRQIYPDATAAQYKMRQKDCEKSLRVMRLRNPALDVHRMWVQDAEDEGSGNEGYLDQQFVRTDISVLEHAYQLLDAAGPEGMTQKAIATKLGLTKLNSRVIIRNLERLKYISNYLQDIGRQRVTTFILIKYKESLEQSFKEKTNISIIEDAFKADLIHPKAPDYSAIGLQTDNVLELDQQSSRVLEVKLAMDSENITATDLEAAFGPNRRPVVKAPKPELAEDLHINAVVVKINEIDAPFLGKNKKLTRPLIDEQITVRVAKRMSIIEQTVNHLGVLEDLSKVFSIVQQEERRMGYTDEMCRRSIHRIVTRMKADNKLRLFGVKFSLKNTHTQLMFVCKNDIDETNPMMLSTVEKEKFKFLLRLNNVRARLKVLRAPVTLKECNDPSKNRKIQNSHSSKTSTNTDVERVPKSKSSQFNSESVYGITPKFHKIRSMHEFLFYLVYDYPATAQVLQPADVIPEWKLKNPHMDYDELLPELPPIYSKEIGWKMFVPPISPYPPYSETGWVLFSEALLRLPLSIYVSISNIHFDVTGLDELLKHPIRKHYLLSYIPVEVQNQLLATRKHIFHLSEVTKRAACLGLLQYGPQRQKDKSQVFLFLNRNATLYDTIKSKPGTFFTTEQEYPVLKYHFLTYEDLATYWSNLHRICVNTLLGKRMLSNYVMLRWDMQPNLAKCYANHTREMVLNNDVGALPGDGRGAAGLDSSFFAHLGRNWAFQRSKPKPRKAFVPKTKPTRIVRSAVKKRRPEKPSSQTATVSRTTKIVPIKRLVRRSTMNITVKLAKKRGRQQTYDDVDKQALRRMVKLRVDWSQQEDDLLLLCRAAMQILSPSTRKINISHQQIRDILHWDLKSYDKTSRACQRRITYMLKSESVAQNVFLLVQEIMQNQQIRHRFNKRLYHRLRKQIPEESLFTYAFFTQYVDLVYMLKTNLYSVRGGSQAKCQAVRLPETLEEFHERFHTKIESYSHDRLKFNAPTSWSEIEITVMCGLIHSSCCCVYDKTSWNIQLYEIYKNYTDRVLGEAMTKVREDQLISVNKLNNASRESVKTLPLSASPFHLSATYSFSMLTKIPLRLFGEAHTWYHKMSDSAGQRELPLKGIDGGCVLLLAELLFHKPGVRIDIEIPNPVLVFDTSKCPENKVLLERINTRFRKIFDFVQNDNKDKIAAEMSADKKASRRVTISTEDHRTMEYHVSAVERLMKMDETMYHFYCVLNKLGNRTTMSRLTIDGDHRCQFDCVLGQVNPVGVAIEIIRRNADCLPKIFEEDQMELRFIQGEFELNVFNVLSVFNVLVDKRFKTQQDPINGPEEVTDHGMLQISMDILRDDKDPNQMNLDMGEDDACNEETMQSPTDDFVDADLDEVVCGDRNGEKIYKMHDYFFLNPCRLTMVMDRPDDLTQADELGKQAFLEQVTSECIWSTNYLTETDLQVLLSNELIDEEERSNCFAIMEFLMDKQELGATNVELLDRFRDRNLLLKCIGSLQRLCLILKAGVIEVTYIHGKFTKPWLVETYNMKRLQRETVVPVPYQLIEVAHTSKSEPSTSTGRKRKHSQTLETEHTVADPETEIPTPEKKLLRPNRMTKLTIAKREGLPESSQPTSKITFQVLIKPWIRVNGSLNRRVLDRWIGVVLMHCISCPESTMDTIMRRFNLVVPAHVRDIIRYMERLNLVRMMAIRERPRPTTLWSSYESPEIVKATDLDHNQAVFVEILPDAMTRYMLFVGEKQYKKEFV